jgi:hypothetical protein
LESLFWFFFLQKKEQAFFNSLPIFTKKVTKNILNGSLIISMQMDSVTMRHSVAVIAGD